MISLVAFYRAYEAFRPPPDKAQREAIDAGAAEALFVVAGPGTGKTTCLTLRILKLILVDDVPPRAILATTFTKKAAAELRSRILGWGFRILDQLKEANLPEAVRERLARVDVNQVLTGTIDSICEQLLRDYRDPGTQPPVIADDYVAKTLLLREGFLSSGKYQDLDLDAFLLVLHGGSKWGWHLGRKNDLVQSIWDRRFHDQVDWAAFIAGGPPRERKARQALAEVVSAYEKALVDRMMVDFARLEQEVLDRLRSGQLSDFLDQIRVVLVDEYQDTNLLQEGLYFELAKACHGALTVVGDDDQSLYRFRGATVELFSDFASRYRTSFGTEPSTVFLKTNYRSTCTIVGLVNSYATLDRGYQAVRVKEKPALVDGPKAVQGVPVLGMFRDNIAMLAEDLAAFVHRIFRGDGVELQKGTRLVRSADSGDVGDCALLCSSPAEYNAGGERRLPLLLRNELRVKSPPIEVFNPRGQDLTDIDVVARFGGLLLECLDPGAAVEALTRGLSREIVSEFNDWRTEAIRFAESPTAPAGLKEFAVEWAERNPGRPGWEWPRSVPVLELIYGLVHYFPQLHDDPEGQIYLEVFTRQVSACEQVGKFSGRVVTDSTNAELSRRSVMELLRDFLAPIASGAIGVNEELVDAFPRDRLSVLSIHQAKGLEFPLTIADVGSDFKNNAAGHRFKRYPSGGSTPHAMEDLLRPHTTLGAPRRSGQNRAFDDLYRQFFVAYSRPQEVLLLVGLRKTLPGGVVQNVATGWRREGSCPWDGKRPFVEI